MKKLNLHVAVLFMAFVSQTAFAQQDATDQAGTSEADATEVAGDADPYAKTLAGATQLGEGPGQLWEKDGQTFLTLPPDLLNRIFMWYAEAVSLPVGVISSGGNAIGETVVRLERRGDTIFVRDLAGESARRAAVSNAGPLSKAKLAPIQLAVESVTLGSVLFGMPILAEGPDGKLLMDVTDVFSSDIGGPLAAASVLAGPLGPPIHDPSRSWIERARSFPENLSIRSHLTFASPDGSSQSMIVGHSLAILPEEPMTPRIASPYMGYFSTSFVEFGDDTPVRDVNYILRHRLERADPNASGLSDPVQPLVYYIGQGIPDRWRPYVKEGIEMWNLAFEAAGFSNAIVARDAPTPEEDPEWSAEDARINVVRWLPQEVANAMGPVIYDPRSGEILSAHILVWPSVVPFFETYYYLLHNAVDEEANNLPLSPELQGELMRYVIAHEVGHTLGLRHNHLASTVWSIAQQRDPDFMAANGPNGSIMAYGRWNQAAQPGDGVETFYPRITAYDRLAIEYGYRDFGDAQETKVGLSKLIERSLNNRPLRWAAAEMPSESRQGNDPRVQRENTASDRVEATRLVTARLYLALANLRDASGNDDDVIRAAYDQALSRYFSFVQSVLANVGGVYDEPVNTARYRPVPAAEQRRSVRFVLEEVPDALDMFEMPELIDSLEPAGARLTLDGAAAQSVSLLLTGVRLGLLDEQQRRDPDAYGPVDLGDDMLAALFDDLGESDPRRRAMQSAFVQSTWDVLVAPPAPRGTLTFLATLLGADADQLNTSASTGAETAYPSWARARLPQLATRLRAAAGGSEDPAVSGHYEELALRIDAALSGKSPPSAADALGAALGGANLTDLRQQSGPMPGTSPLR
ncbi:zinc-dependent metalloprotease [Lutimaribacter marinistellae]|uniref:Zinc-dependent metalloprotease n=1 Tax=Lutimaribacter marinistellae TaxID=1820329 RepID=A0ABV7TET6_9RHOB